MLDISVSSPSLQQSNLVAAREDFFAARYSSCIEACSAAIENESENSKEALILRARALLRMSKPSDVIASISRELSAFTDSNGKLEAQIQLATAHALVGDFASASSYIADLVSQVEATTPSTLRSEIAYTSAFVAWARGDLIEAEKLLVEKAGESSWSRARRVILKSWIASKRQNFEEHTRLLLEGCNTLQTTGPLDVGSLAPAVRAVCNMAREIPRAGLQAEAQALYDSIPWTDELGADNFMSCRALGWGLSLEGESRYFESLRLLHKATSLAPSQAWKVWALLDRAARKRYAGELGASSADLFEAVQICDQVDWANTIDEERLGLLYAAELCAAVDLGQASTFLAQYSQHQSSVSSRLVMRGDPRTSAAQAFSTGIVYEVLADQKKAKQFFESAYSTYSEIGYAWRAARAAQRLYTVTQDSAWYEAARKWIRSYPHSWIADEIRAASSGVGDEGWNRLTPRQREVFGALCEGLTAKKIAERLSCSPNTVRNHIHWVYNAFRVDSQPELIAEARRRRLI